MGHHVQINGVKTSRARRGGLEERGHQTLGRAQIRKCLDVAVKEEDHERRNGQQQNGDQKHDLGVQTAASQTEMVQVKIFPDEEAQTADDDEQHNGDVDHRVGYEVGDGALTGDTRHEVAARVAECRDRVKDGIIDAAHRAEHGDKAGCENDRTDALKQQNTLEDKAGQSNNATQCGCTDRFLHGESLAQTDALAADYKNHDRHGQKAHTADLDEAENDELTEQRPVGCGRYDDQTGHTGGRSRREQRIRERSPDTRLGSERRGQQNRTKQNDGRVSEQDNLRGGQRGQAEAFCFAHSR